MGCADYGRINGSLKSGRVFSCVGTFQCHCCSFLYFSCSQVSLYCGFLYIIFLVVIVLFVRGKCVGFCEHFIRAVIIASDWEILGRKRALSGKYISFYGYFLVGIFFFAAVFSVAVNLER